MATTSPVETYWGLCRPPFPARPTARDFYRSGTHVESLARLHYLVARQHRLGLLIGDAGSGKSLLCQALAEELRPRRALAQVSAAGVDVRELLWLTANQWRLNPPLDATTFWLRRRLDDALVEQRYQQLTSVLVVDDAVAATGEVQAEIDRLAHQASAGESPLTIVLATRFEARSRLDRRLLDLAHLAVELEPWDEPTVADFVEAALASAGRREPAFDGDAVQRLFELSQGIPRTVAKLAELALVAGAGQRATIVDPSIVEQVYDELVGDHPPHEFEPRGA